MAEAERLEDAPKAMIEVITKHDHGKDVEERDGPYLEACDDVVVNVVLVEGPAGVYGSERKVQKVEDHESRDDGTAPQHGPRSVGGIEAGPLDVLDGPCLPLQKPELERRPDVQDDGNEQSDPSAPKEGRERSQSSRIVIDFFRWKKDL